MHWSDEVFLTMKGKYGVRQHGMFDVPSEFHVFDNFEDIWKVPFVARHTEREECKVTGFSGIAYGRCEYFNGCIQIDVKPRINKTGEYVKGLWMDEQQLKIIKKRAVRPENHEPVKKKTVCKKKSVGGPMRVSS